MASAEVMTEIETLIRNNWTHFTGTAIRGFESDPDLEVPRDNSPFGEITFPVEGVEDRGSFGTTSSNLYREANGFRFCVYIGKKEEIVTWVGRMDDLRDVLRNWRSTDGHLRIQEVASPSINLRSPLRGYREISIGVAYTHDIFR